MPPPCPPLCPNRFPLPPKDILFQSKFVARNRRGDTLELAQLLQLIEAKSGKKLSAKNFDDRLRMQKVVYLLKEMDHPAGRPYSFSMYHHGPYSPGLAKEYYALLDGKPGRKVSDGRPGRRDTEAIDVIAKALGKDTKFLEAVATYRFVQEQNPGERAEVVRSVTLKLKPHVKGVIGEAIEFLEQSPLATST